MYLCSMNFEGGKMIESGRWARKGLVEAIRKLLHQLHDLGGIERTQAAQVIQRAWFSHMDKMMFQLLKHTICAAENCVTHEILKKVCPLEAALVRDPSVQCKVRFRFGGKTFPPFIVFKIFLHTGGHGNKYFSGKNTLRPSSEAVVDACKLMGNRKYYDQIIQDQLQFQKYKVADEVDVVTMKDYMHFTSFLDETPAYLGGKSNRWRRLSLENFPKTMIMYDIMDYATSGTLSDRLQKELKYLLQKPKSEAMQRDQLRVVSQIRSFQCGQLGGTVDRAPVQESGGPKFKFHFRHLTFTSCVTLGKSLNPNCLILGHLQST
ncbi:uncharacterized protein CXorf58 homolog isoform X4 [Notamacropus eugenii]|uniref:uncharacterized protein CXorf58 homolog isoform X4 n=1 Tax=Notamacropus eugenii TaxID=9315 RepID=UPI003B670A4B